MARDMAFFTVEVPHTTTGVSAQDPGTARQVVQAAAYEQTRVTDVTADAAGAGWVVGGYCEPSRPGTDLDAGLERQFEAFRARGLTPHRDIP